MCKRSGCSATSSSAAGGTRPRSRCSSCSAPRRCSGRNGMRSRSMARTASFTRRGPPRPTTWATTRSATAGSSGTRGPFRRRSPAAPPRYTGTSSPSGSSASPDNCNPRPDSPTRKEALMDDDILYEVIDKVAVITLNRPQRANAQTMEMLDDLDAAWSAAAYDDDVTVIVLRANGKHFSSGHDLGSGMTPPEKITLEWIYKLEARKYLEYSLRWRNVPKPSIAAVQGKCTAGGLLLAWPCDLIVAAENAEFSDPVVFLGIGGVEYHGHTWELGPRKAKEILFTGRAVTAREAEQTGMVNRVVDLDRLQDETMDLARHIAQMDAFALRQAKRAVNQTLDIQGFYAAIQSVFDIHHTGHGNAISRTGYPIIARADQMKEHIASQ